MATYSCSSDLKQREEETELNVRKQSSEPGKKVAGDFWYLPFNSYFLLVKQKTL